MTLATPPARRVLADVEALTARLGHTNHGPLSEAAGFLPHPAPPEALPASHRAWDELAAALPELHRSLELRHAVAGLPLLPADRRALADRHLLRAASVLGLAAHAFVRVDPRVPASLPVSLGRPWAAVCRRLGRPGPVLTYLDLIVGNWRISPAAAPPAPHRLRVETLQLLVPTVGSPEERVFYLTQTEILARTAPLVGAVARAQEAVCREDMPALRAELARMADVLDEVTHRALPKIDPDPRSPTHVDPVGWAKTVAPLAVPLRDGAPGPSGTSSPLFHLLDVFLGRAPYESLLGEEAVRLRRAYPPAWRTFLRAVDAVDVPEHVRASGDPALATLLAAVQRAYAGEGGFLDRHRRKVYGYLETAFKVGRDVTIGGFSGLFRDRTWDEVDDALEEAQEERRTDADDRADWHHLPVGAGSGWTGDTAHVVLDAAGRGIRPRPGDRVEVLPEHAPAAVERALARLGLDGDAVLQLDAAWRRAARPRPGLGAASTLPVRHVLRYGQLHRLSEAPVTIQDLCRALPPEPPRLYSIASAPEDATGAARALHLLVGQAGEGRPGSASAYLARVASGQEGADHRVTVRLSPARRLRPPEDPRRPVVLVAGGSGLAPFVRLLEDRREVEGAGPAWLLVAVRTAADLPLREELGRLVAEGVRLDVAVTREDVAFRLDERGHLVASPGTRRRIDGLLGDPAIAESLWHHLRGLDEAGSGAVFHICGSHGFAATATAALEAVAVRFGGSERGSGLVDRLVRQQRLHREVHGEPAGAPSAPPGADVPELDLSEVAVHNDAENGYWLVIDDWVHDLTSFLSEHPGGAHTLRSYAGMDATAAYRRVGHHRQQEPAASSLGLRIGKVRRPALDSPGRGGPGPEGGAGGAPGPRQAYRCWLGYLQLVVEMENALRLDYSTRGRPTTRGERADDRPPHRLLLVVDVHRRFLHGYVEDLLGEQLATLWRITAGASPREVRQRLADVAWAAPDWMAERSAEVRCGPAARAAAATLEGLEVAAREGGAADRARLWPVTQLLERESAVLLRRAKHVARIGLQRFEQRGADALQHPLALLIGAARIPAQVVDFHTRVSLDPVMLPGAVQGRALEPV